MRTELTKSLLRVASSKKMIFLTGDLGYMALESLKEKLKNAKTAELRAKYKAQIETEMRKLAAKEKVNPMPRPKPKPKPPVKNSGTVQTSLRPKKRPTT